MIANDINYFGSPEYHWVVLRSEMIISNEYNTDYIYDEDKIMTVNFKVYSWGSDEKKMGKQYLQKPITLNHFKYNYYGFIKLK